MKTPGGIRWGQRFLGGQRRNPWWDDRGNTVFDRCCPMIRRHEYQTTMNELYIIICIYIILAVVSHIIISICMLMDNGYYHY